MKRRRARNRRVILDNLAAGRNAEEIIESHPSLTSADVRAALAYAAELAYERTVVDETA